MPLKRTTLSRSAFRSLFVPLFRHWPPTNVHPLSNVDFSAPARPIMTPAPTANAPVTPSITLTESGTGREVPGPSTGPVVDVGSAVAVVVGGAVTVAGP